MRIIFRVDASIEMGTGHVMRCLTLADALKEQSAECHFICREHLGHLNALITERGHTGRSLILSATPNQFGKVLQHDIPRT